MRGVVADELLKVKDQYGDRRRTQIINVSANGKATKTLTARDLMPEQQVWIGVTDDGLVSRTHDDKQPRQSGNDAPRWLVKASTTDTVYFVAKSDELPPWPRTSSRKRTSFRKARCSIE